MNKSLKLRPSSGAGFLAHHKLLTLSVALNVLLAVALAMLFQQVYPQFAYRLESVSNWGRYSVRTYRDYTGTMAYFEVLMGPAQDRQGPQVPRRIYSHSGKQAFFVKTFGADLTGNGLPDLVVAQWSGSAHGDSKYLVLELDGSAVREVDILDGLTDIECRDLNDDGIGEITGAERCYDYFLGDSCAASPRPPVVLSFGKIQRRFVLDRKLMPKPPWSAEQLDKLSLTYKTDARWSQECRPPAGLFDTMLQLIYSGHEKQAWELFDASWPDGSSVPKEQYREDVTGELHRSRFYPVIADWAMRKS
jgi:hypothetical protein